jgi:spermidine synthase
MGGTLTLLIRHLVRRNLEGAGAHVARLYGINTAGAALGCFLTDFALVPSIGLRWTQLLAVILNLIVAATALMMARGGVAERSTESAQPAAPARPAQPARSAATRNKRELRGPMKDRISDVPAPATTLTLTGAALFLTGFASLGLEIVWFRHFTLLLGGFRGVFSLLLTVLLVGIGCGSLLGAPLERRMGRPAQWLMLSQGLFVVATLFGLTTTSAPALLAGNSALAPMLTEIALPALLMGLTFPLANALVQHAELSVGRRAGVLYLANTIGGVCGSLAAGFLLLPLFGMQISVTVLAVAAGLSIVPLFFAARMADAAGTRPAGASLAISLASAAIATVAVALWLGLPSAYLLTRAQPAPTTGERILDMTEGVDEVVTIADVPEEGRQLLTNGHPMSSTNPMSQRYMRALVHIPLLSMERPADSVLVIGFGVGETLSAAALHPSVAHVELADLSTNVLAHAKYFRDTNNDALNNPKVSVYVNDGRQHLRMQPAGKYDLIALEPPPITHAGVGALYSEDFYQLARTRLKPGGYLSQWLPAYQVPAEITLSMVRAFVNAFPEAVRLSGADAELLLVGTTAPRIEIDPASVSTALAGAPAVHMDLNRLNLGTIRELVGTFTGSPKLLAEATTSVPPVTDDRPLQEYTAQSVLTAVRGGVPAALIDLNQAAAWCPKCFNDVGPVPAAEGLDRYLLLLAAAYKGATPPADGPASLKDPRTLQMVLDSPYLKRMFNDVHVLLGRALLEAGRPKEAAAEFREGLRTDPNSFPLHFALGSALAADEAMADAVQEFATAARIAPASADVRYALARAYLAAKQYGPAVDEFRVAAQMMPASSELHNNFGIALTALNRLDEAAAEFRQALTLRPDFADARQRLNTVLDMQRRAGRTR